MASMKTTCSNRTTANTLLPFGNLPAHDFDVMIPSHRVPHELRVFMFVVSHLVDRPGIVYCKPSTWSDPAWQRIRSDLRNLQPGMMEDSIVGIIWQLA
jgi:hypothetical protein